MAFSFICHHCRQVHEGMPSFGTDSPASFDAIPPHERNARCFLSADDCVIDGRWFFLRGLIEIPVAGEDEAFTWIVWASVSEASHRIWRDSREEPRRSHLGPFFGWLNTSLPFYPETLELKCRVHLRDHGLRPFIELEPTDHPLAVEQRHGITGARVESFATALLHSAPAG